MSRVLVLVHVVFFFFNDTATTEIYTLSLHDALPISHVPGAGISIPSTTLVASPIFDLLPIRGPRLDPSAGASLWLPLQLLHVQHSTRSLRRQPLLVHFRSEWTNERSTRPSPHGWPWWRPIPPPWTQWRPR